MATYTSNYNLAKPEGSDKAQISVLNNDFDAIDAQMKKNADAAADAQKAADGKQDPITVDDAPVQNSTNPIQSGAVYTINQTLTKAIESETSARETLEKTVSADSTALNELTTEAAEEVERAKAAEEKNASAISAEVSRAEAAEAANAKKLQEYKDDLGLSVDDEGYIVQDIAE